LDNNDPFCEDTLDWLCDDSTEVTEDDTTNSDPWVVLVVDDDAGVHLATDMAIKHFRFEHSPLELIHAYSGQECLSIMASRDDVALILLDVVMESEDAGLNVVNYVRSELANNTTRIILRTGQPGLAPEHSVIRDYDIDGYSNKTQMTQQHLEGALYTSLRAYRDISRLNNHKQTIERIVDAISNISVIRDLSALRKEIFGQCKATLSVDNLSFFIVCIDSSQTQHKQANIKALTADDKSTKFHQQYNTKMLSASQQSMLKASLERRENFRLDNYILEFKSQGECDYLLAIEAETDYTDEDLPLIRLFLNNVILTYQRVLKQSMLGTQGSAM